MKSKIILLSFMALSFINIKGQAIEDCADCNMKLLIEKQLQNKSVEELQLLRNEIFARNGYRFSNENIAFYFSEKNWYKPAASNNDIKLNNVEQKNVALIKQIETQKQNKRNAAIKDLQKLKTALNDNNTQIINAFLDKPFAKDWFEDNIHLKNVLNKIAFDDIHWNKSAGIYKVTIDNGFGIAEYKIVFNSNDTIEIRYSDTGFSEIYTGFEYSGQEFMLENEFTVLWFFEMQETGITLVAVNGAG